MAKKKTQLQKLLPSERGVKEALSNPASASTVMAVVGFFAGLPLWLSIPVILISAGLSIILVLQILPIVVAGIVYVLSFVALRYSKMNEPYLYFIPLLPAAVAFVPMWIGPVQSAVASAIGGQVSSAAVQSQIIGEIQSLVALPQLMATIVTFAFVIVAIVSLKGIPVVGKPLAGVVSLISFAVLFLGFSFAGVGLSGVVEGESIATGDTVPVTFFITDSADNPSLVDITIRETGEVAITTSVATFNLDSNEIVHVDITHQGGVSTRVFIIGVSPETITIKGFVGLGE